MIASLTLAAVLTTALPEGEWVRIFREPKQVLGLLSDSQGSIYVLPAGKVYRDGRFDSLPSLRGYPEEVVLLDRSEYWVASRDFGPGGIDWQSPKGLITHYHDGQATRYDTANSCLDGNLFRLLGRDRDGKLIVDQRYFSGLGGPTQGVLRFDGETCQPIPLGLVGEAGAIAYARDSAGREYFSIRDISDVPIGRGLLRLQGGKVDTLAPDISPTKLVARGDGLYAAAGGLWVFTGTGIRKTTKILGKELRGVRDFLFDSRGVLWIGTEGYDFQAENLGLVAVSGPDTVIYNQDNSDFPGYFASALAEDAHGNIWVGTWEHGLAVFARDRAVLATGRAERPGRTAAPGLFQPPSPTLRDLLGRLRRAR